MFVNPFLISLLLVCNGKGTAFTKGEKLIIPKRAGEFSYTYKEKT